ncbi:MAG: hypothetical protein JSR79_03255 [Proteobacteria bacterium]|nr:hypothetical protein [Pseudomonadota bacterium]
MAALVAALLIRATGQSTGWVAIVAERSRRTGAVLGGALTALIVTHAVAATAGYFIGRHITPNPRQLMLGLALLAAATGAVWPGKIKPVAFRRPFIDTLAHLVSNGIGGRSEFVLFAIALGGRPVLAGVGGVIGGSVILAAAGVAGETLWSARPRRAIGWTIGGVLAIAGAWLALAALRLI